MKLYENYLTRLIGIKNDTAISIIKSLNIKLANDLSTAFDKCRNLENNEYEKCVKSNSRKAYLDFLLNAKKGLNMCDDGDEDCEHYINKEIDVVKEKLRTNSVLFGD